jgi:hypothetical protein
MHEFMDAADVAPAWRLMQRGEHSNEPRLRETQERVAACHYAMAHPETGISCPPASSMPSSTRPRTSRCAGCCR